jgi:hypothetical protein
MRTAKHKPVMAASFSPQTHTLAIVDGSLFCQTTGSLRFWNLSESQVSRRPRRRQDEQKAENTYSCGLTRVHRYWSHRGRHRGGRCRTAMAAMRIVFSRIGILGSDVLFRSKHLTTGGRDCRVSFYGKIPHNPLALAGTQGGERVASHRVYVPWFPRAIINR